MKNILLLTVLCISMSFSTLGNPIPTEKMHKYDLNEEASIMLPTNFAEHFLLTPELINEISGKQIHHIDLVYTSYKEAPNFNQQALNTRRKQQLIKALPQINRDNPSWKLIEQTGAKTREEANDYFHGFVIHFSEELAYEALTKFLEPLQAPFSYYTADNSVGGTFTYESGSTIKLPPNAVTYEDGTPVNGNYSLKYREFRDPADMAFSGIPMTYQNYNFSSAGMYEIRAEQNGQPLKLQKPAQVDFNCTMQADDVDFYAMDDSNGEWKKIAPLAFNKTAEPLTTERNPAIEFSSRNVDGEKLEWTVTELNNLTQVEFSKEMWSLVQAKRDQDQSMEANIISEDPAKRLLRVENKDQKKLMTFINGSLAMQWQPIEEDTPQARDFLKNNSNATLLAEGADAGHTYPNLVKGLNSPEFGVYNCDQIYRLGTPTQVSPIYVDAKSGKKISNKLVACLIDLNYNGSFSFHPNSITCDAMGRNVLILFTKDKKTYLLSEDKFDACDVAENNRPKFKMVDMTEELKSPEDLREYLNL